MHCLRRKIFDPIAKERDYETAIKILSVILGESGSGTPVTGLPVSVKQAFGEFNDTVFKIYQSYLICYIKVKIEGISLKIGI